MSKVNAQDVLRQGSAIAKAYNLLKDGKVHKLSTVRASLNKAGVKRPLGMLFRMCRTLRSHGTGQMVSMSKRSDTVQLVPFTPAGSRPKSVAKKPVAKKAKASKVLVAAGNDDDVLEEE